MSGSTNNRNRKSRKHNRNTLFFHELGTVYETPEEDGNISPEEHAQQAAQAKNVQEAQRKLQQEQLQKHKKDLEESLPDAVKQEFEKQRQGHKTQCFVQGLDPNRTPAESHIFPGKQKKVSKNNASSRSELYRQLQRTQRRKSGKNVVYQSDKDANLPPLYETPVAQLPSVKPQKGKKSSGKSKTSSGNNALQRVKSFFKKPR